VAARPPEAFTDQQDDVVGWVLVALAAVPTDSPLTELLSEQPGDRLSEWSDRLANQIVQLQFEKQLVDQALTKRTSYSSRPAKRTGGAASGAHWGGRSSGVSRQTVYELVRERRRPVSPNDVRAMLAARGIETGTEAMRMALNRLVGDGLLIKVEAGVFALHEHHTANGDGDGEPLSRPLPERRTTRARTD
jgi:hypothetical protein